MPDQVTDLKTVQELLDEATRLRSPAPQDSIKAAEEALRLADVLNDMRGKANACLNLGATFKQLSRFTDSFQMVTRALELYREVDDRIGTADSLGLLGNLYFFLGDFEQALKYQREALEIRETLGDQRRISYSINSLGVIYATLEDFKTAEQYFQRSYEVIKSMGEGYGLAIMINNLAVASYEQKKYDKAISLFMEAEKYAAQQNDLGMLGEICVNVGDCYRDKDDFENARESYAKAMKVIGGRRNLTESKYFTGVARLELKRRNYDAARTACQESVEILKVIGVNDFLAKSYKLLADVEIAAGDYKKAIESLHMYFSIKEEMHKEELKKKSDNLNLIHQAEKMKREAEINYLKNVELKKAYDKIEMFNQNLTDSIQYAKSFQDIIFGKYERSMRSAFPSSEYFALPKDIVSGDFMWFCEKEDYSILALADCTGHGVPGAFVSMLGNDLLNKAVLEHNLRMPYEIVHYLHEALGKHFPDTELAPKQGMDVLVVKLNRNGGLSWSGARGQGLLVRKGYPAQELKGDRIFLGGNVLHEFSSWESMMKKGDRLYLFSDGIMDQKGEKGKFSQARLTGLLEQPGRPGEVIERVKKAVEDWKGSLTQVDDMSLVAIEF